MCFFDTEWIEPKEHFLNNNVHYVSTVQLVFWSHIYDFYAAAIYDCSRGGGRDAANVPRTQVFVYLLVYLFLNYFDNQRQWLFSS